MCLHPINEIWIDHGRSSFFQSWRSHPQLPSFSRCSCLTLSFRLASPPPLSGSLRCRMAAMGGKPRAVGWA